MHDSRMFPANPSEAGVDALPPLLGINSVLADLPLHDAPIDLTASAAQAADRFNQAPLLPGLVLLTPAGVAGILSRQRFLDCLLKPGGYDLFSQQPLAVLWSYAHTPALVLSAETPILKASQLALRRSLECQGEPIGVQLEDRVALLNVHDLNIASWQLRGVETQVRYERFQAQMLQSEKMAALGRLVDGVAHEVLDPVGFIWGNLTHLASYVRDLIALLDAYRTAYPQVSQELQDLQEAVELDYLRTDLPKTIQSIQSGADRLKKLALSLQNFCHIDEVYPRPADLHTLLDSLLLLLKSRIATPIQVRRDYGSLPPVTCYSGQLGQVLMTVLSLSLDRLLAQTLQQEAASRFQQQRAPLTPPAALGPPQIWITTRLGDPPGPLATGRDHPWVFITIADTGPPLEAEVLRELMADVSPEQRRLRETSLAISYRIITAKHGGQFRVRTRTPGEAAAPAGELPLPPGINAEFAISLPLFPPGEGPPKVLA